MKEVWGGVGLLGGKGEGEVSGECGGGGIGNALMIRRREGTVCGAGYLGARTRGSFNIR